MMKPLACLIATALFSVTAIAKDKEKGKDQAPPVPSATLADVRYGPQVNDAPFNKDELTGKVVVVEEWGVNCPPCVASLPGMAKLAKSNAKKGLVVVGLECQNSPKEAILKLLKAARVEYPVMAGGAAPGGTGTIPHFVVFDTSGTLVYNARPADENFERAVKKALRDVKK